MIVCEHNSCMRDLALSDFKRRDMYPCCGKPIGQTINWPEPKLVVKEVEPQVEIELPVEELPVEEPPVEEPVVAKAPAKKVPPKAKKAKKGKK